MVDNRLDKIIDILSDHNVVLSEIRKDLNYHIKRTNILEEKIIDQDNQLKEAILPITWMKITGKLVLWILPIVGIILAYLQLKS